jgi:thiamine pyrophosphokinase
LAEGAGFLVEMDADLSHDPADLPRLIAPALDGADLVVAADDGAGTLDRLGRRPGLLVGDLDSVEPPLVTKLEEAGVPIERHPADKDATDTELALRAGVGLGATEIVLLGALGGNRFDHELANILLLADPEAARLPVRIVRGPTTARVLRAGLLVLEGRAGSLVSLMPIGADATGVTTAGLRWPLEGATLSVGRSRGISNEVVATPASVTVRDGTLLVVETASQGAPSP